ncbi:MAG: hypothetical protein WBF66_00260 [Dehalococcoidia bacterium]
MASSSKTTEARGHLRRGQRSERILEVLGHQYGEEVVHRDNLVVL